MQKVQGKRGEKHKAQNSEEKEESEVTQEGEEPRSCSHSRKSLECRIIHGSSNFDNNNDELMDIGSGEQVDKQNTKESEKLEL